MTATPELSGQLGRYIIVRKLGAGGMGAVYLAEDTQLGRKVALKVPLLGEDPIAVERFRREARLAATIDHPNLCPVFDVGETRGILYFTMPFIEGTPLAKLVGKGSPWEVPQAIELMRKVSAAVAHLHSCGIIHRDLKPGNIMVRGSGDPVLMDFGLARMYEAQTQHLTGTGVPLGSPAYMAPEQIQGAHDSSPPTDVYGLAMILYQLVAGRLPFEGPLQTLYYLILSTPPPPPSQFNPGLDPRLDALILRALSKRAEDRGYTAESFGQALAAVLTQPLVASKPASQHTDSTRGGGATQPSRAQAPLSQVATILPGQVPAPAAIPVAQPRAPLQPPRQEVRRATIPRGQWYLRVRGTVTGPFSGEQLYQKYTRSEVGRFHEASTDQLNWGSVAAVLGLQPGQPEPPPVKNEFEQTMMVSAEEPALVSSGSGRRSSNGLDQLLLAAILRTGATFLAGTGLFLALALREMPVLGVSVIVGVVLVLYAGVVRFWGLHLGKHLPARVNLARYGPLMEILAGVTVALTALYALVLILADAFTKSTPTDAIKVGLTGGVGLLLVLAVLPDVARTVLHLLVMRAALAPLPNGSRHMFVVLVSFAALVVVGLGLYLIVLTSLLSSDRIPGGVAPLALLLLLASVVWQVCITVLTYRMKGLLGSA